MKSQYAKKEKWKLLLGYQIIQTFYLVSIYLFYGFCNNKSTAVSKQNINNSILLLMRPIWCTALIKKDHFVAQTQNFTSSSQNIYFFLLYSCCLGDTWQKFTSKEKQWLLQKFLTVITSNRWTTKIYWQI